MKDLFISFGSSICVQNFVEGPLYCKELQSDEVAGIIATTRAEGGKIKGYYDFSSELSEEEDRRLQQLLVAFETATGTRLTNNDFYYECDEDGDQFPIINYVPTVTETCSMLVVEYFIQCSILEDGQIFKPSNPYAADGMSFYLFEKQQKRASKQKAFFSDGIPDDIAHSGLIRPLIPTASGHPFRFDPAIDSGAFGPPL
ncbi:hypothetical protein SAMN04515647_0432 [Cohaesibacter sp. ES.047]|nr:hypothetical protein SAMN04515647_0432 [Cohaesibacter sp. ES.047]